MAMSSAAPAIDHPLTVAEFLAWDDGTQTRYELVDGQPVAMAPPSTRHADIVENIAAALAPRLPAGCRVYRTKVGVALGAGEGTWREPDLVVTCQRPEPGFVAAPRLVVEVLSPSTEHADRTSKLDFYETVPGLEAILLVWQDQRRVRLRVPDGTGWRDQDAIGAGEVRVAVIGASLTLDEIYADPWGQAEG